MRRLGKSIPRKPATAAPIDDRMIVIAVAVVALLALARIAFRISNKRKPEDDEDEELINDADDLLAGDDASSVASSAELIEQ